MPSARAILRLLLFLCLLLGSVLLLHAQTTESGSSKGAALVSYEMNWPEGDPQWYQISIDSAGHGIYKSQPHLAPDESAGEPYVLEFTASPKGTERIFHLAAELHYFRGQFDDLGRKVAQTGVKTLHYQDATQSNSTSYNASTNRQLGDLTTLMQDIASTLEFDGKLRYAMRFDHLGLADLLKSMEEMNKSGQLAELQILTPTLHAIAEDPEAMNLVRQHARRLLAAAGERKP